MHIEQYEFGRIEIGESEYTDDVIVTPDEVDDSWWRRKGHEVCRADLAPVKSHDPDIVVIGTGKNGVMKVLPEARSELEEMCDQVHVLRTDAAVKRFNELAEKEEKGRGGVVLGAFHLTC